MFGISGKNSNSSQSLLSQESRSNNRTKRRTSYEPDQNSLSRLFKRVAKAISQQLGAAKSDSNPSSVNNPSRQSDESDTRHITKRVHFPSSAAASIRQAFPFQVSHTYSGSVHACPTAPSVSSLLPQLADSLANKQGFVYIRDSAGQSPVNQFVDTFRHRGSVELGNGCRLIGAYTPPPQNQSVFSPMWMFQIYDSNLEATFEVPVTEVPFDDLSNAANRTEQLIHLNNCMDTHLRALPDAFKDSPECSTIICPQCPRLAQLLTAQEECLGRQYRGELNCREGVDWIYAGEKLLETISPEVPRFQGEESCDFLSFFRRTGVYNIGLKAMPYSIAHPQANLLEPGVIRGYKRHLPNDQTTISPSSASTSSLSSGHDAQAPQRNSIATEPPGPDWLQMRDSGRAYKEPVRQMQCASQTINGVLQQHVVTPEIFSAHMAASRLNLLDQLDLPPNEQKGLTHPKLMAGILNGESVEISKREFMGPQPHELDIATEQTPADAWQKLVNLSPLGTGKNWFHHSDELNAIETLRITPDMWLSAQRGAETSELLTLLNDQLKANPRECLPTRMVQWAIREHADEILQIEQIARQSVANGRDFPIVVRTGRESGHFQTIVPDSKGNWLTLNSDGAKLQGVQSCNRWCNAGDLAASLLRADASDILLPSPFNA